MCDEPFCEVISVSLHVSVVTQDGDSALMIAAREGKSKVISLLLKAGANIDLQNEVKCSECVNEEVWFKRKCAVMRSERFLKYHYIHAW